MKTDKSKLQNNNAGFTLVEMVCVFVIMVMLAAMSIVGMLAYQDYADFKKVNTYAQTLFNAASAKMTDYSVHGMLDEMPTDISNEVDLTTVLTPNGEVASESDNGLYAKYHKVYYLTGNEETYEAYVSGAYTGKKDFESRSKVALYELFDEFITDKSILRGTILVEFNPTDGLVYSVFYSDKCKSFSYFSDSEDGIVNVLDRSEGVRSEWMVGYFGVE